MKIIDHEMMEINVNGKLERRRYTVEVISTPNIGRHNPTNFGIGRIRPELYDGEVLVEEISGRMEIVKGPTR